MECDSNKASAISFYLRLKYQAIKIQLSFQMFKKSSSYLVLGNAGLLCVVLVFFRPVPQFNYDF